MIEIEKIDDLIVMGVSLPGRAVRHCAALRCYAHGLALAVPAMAPIPHASKGSSKFLSSLDHQLFEPFGLEKRKWIKPLKTNAENPNQPRKREWGSLFKCEV